MKRRGRHCGDATERVAATIGAVSAMYAETLPLGGHRHVRRLAHATRRHHGRRGPSVRSGGHQDRGAARWTAVCLMAGVVFVAAAAGMSAAVRAGAAALPQAAFIGMGVMVLRERCGPGSRMRSARGSQRPAMDTNRTNGHLPPPAAGSRQASAQLRRIQPSRSAARPNRLTTPVAMAAHVIPAGFRAAQATCSARSLIPRSIFWVMTKSIISAGSTRNRAHGRV